MLTSSALSSSAVAISSCWSAGITVLSLVIWVKLNDSVASRMPPASARPNDSPND